MATELLQPRDLACGNLFQSNCVIQTFIYGLFRRQLKSEHLYTFYRKHEHGALCLLICGTIEKHTYLPTYLFTKILKGQLTMNKLLWNKPPVLRNFNMRMAVTINLHIKFEVCSFIRS